jgi:hypothetical protein
MQKLTLFKPGAASGLIATLLIGSAMPALAQREDRGNRGNQRPVSKVEDSVDVAPDNEERMLKIQGLDDSRSKSDLVKSNIASKAAELQQRKADRMTVKRERLAGIKLETCQSRQEKVILKIEKSTAKAKSLMKKMESIATKAVDFKEAKGIAAEGLEELEAVLLADKQIVEEAIVDAADGATAFDCESEAPKAQLQTFVDDMAEVRTALKQYRTSIHDFVRAIRQANGQHRDGHQASDSATPSATPEASDSAEGAE